MLSCPGRRWLSLLHFPWDGVRQFWCGALRQFSIRWARFSWLKKFWFRVADIEKLGCGDCRPGIRGQLAVPKAALADTLLPFEYIDRQDMWRTSHSHLAISLEQKA